MYDGPIIDSHHHLWHWQKYPWLAAPMTPKMYDADRCFYGSNFPLEKLWASYDDLVGACKQILAHRSAEDQRKFFHDTAADFYRIRPVAERTVAPAQ